jgi:hypothetical protein
MRRTIIGQRLEDIISRADNALDKKYCIEASTIYYAILEERLISLFEKLNITLNRNQKMHHCITEMKKFIQDGLQVALKNGKIINVGPLLAGDFTIQLLDDMDAWRDKRNRVIHDFAKQTIPYSDIEELAIEGKKIVRDFNASVMRFKNKLKKHDSSI